MKKYRNTYIIVVDNFYYNFIKNSKWIKFKKDCLTLKHAIPKATLNDVPNVILNVLLNVVPNVLNVPSIILVAGLSRLFRIFLLYRRGLFRI